ncbi:hypothetical protein [Rhodococcus globerulus]|uniref:hypothetical protein n=1 Tax=Rhodococcus globerulus TaxID=33008 RepID=UPI001C55E587|nr:hypothetical protein [Rhodococcus globerulus]QXW04000.1 hypothetical protein KYT97_08270 [Rhodococcus globerulus]
MSNPNLDILGNILLDKVADQPLVKRYANTATTAVGALVSIVWTLISLGVQLPAQVGQGVLVIIAVFTVVGVKLTPNGVTEKQVEEIEDYVGQHRSES